MAKHNELGTHGESLARKWLSDNGFYVLETNWRVGHLEIDIICHKNNKLHIIEVKCRSGRRFGHPEQRVNKKKIKNMTAAGTSYMHQKNIRGWISYDILSITLCADQPIEFLLIEDIY